MMGPAQEGEAGRRAGCECIGPRVSDVMSDRRCLFEEFKYFPSFLIEICSLLSEHQRMMLQPFGVI